MSAFVKELDPNHLLTTGAEGFYGPSTPQLEAGNPAGNDKSGNDFVRHHALPHIDFATIHVWADHWLQCCTVHCLVPFLRDWLQGHIDVAGELLNKPVVVEEFGARLRCALSPPYAGSSASAPAPPDGSPKSVDALAPPPPPLPAPPPGELLLRNELYKLVYKHGRDAVTEGKAFGGSLFWLLGINGVPDADFYTIYLPQDKTTAQLISEHVVSMRMLESTPTVTAVEPSKPVEAKPKPEAMPKPKVADKKPAKPTKP
jgi:hypothetical protein